MRHGWECSHDHDAGVMTRLADGTIGSAAFSGVGQIRYEVQDGTTLVEADTNGDGRADMTIALEGDIALDDSNFILMNPIPPSAFGATGPSVAPHFGYGIDWPPTLHLA
jgi:hypothetical protein